MAIDPRLVEGIELFNKREFFESHEVIEGLWLEVKGNDRNFYKGLIQAAAAIHHFNNKNLSGARGLFKTSIEYLSQYKPAYMGVNIQRLIGDMKVCFASATSTRADEGVVIQKHLIPVIEFQEPTN